MSENTCGSTRRGSSLRELPAFQTHRVPRVRDDLPCLIQCDRSVPRGFGVVVTALQTEPLIATLPAAQWFVDASTYGSASIVQRGNRIHGRR